MGGLFYTGQSRRTSGSFTVTCSGAEDIVKRLNKLENGGQTAIKKTVNDFMSRAPAQSTRPNNNLGGGRAQSKWRGFKLIVPPSFIRGGH